MSQQYILLTYHNFHPLIHKIFFIIFHKIVRSEESLTASCYSYARRVHIPRGSTVCVRKLLLPEISHMLKWILSEVGIGILESYDDALLSQFHLHTFSHVDINYRNWMWWEIACEWPIFIIFLTFGWFSFFILVVWLWAGASLRMNSTELMTRNTRMRKPVDETEDVGVFETVGDDVGRINFGGPQTQTVSVDSIERILSSFSLLPLCILPSPTSPFSHSHSHSLPIDHYFGTFSALSMGFFSSRPSTSRSWILYYYISSLVCSWVS